MFKDILINNIPYSTLNWRPKQKGFQQYPPTEIYSSVIYSKLITLLNHKTRFLLCHLKDLYHWRQSRQCLNCYLESGVSVGVLVRKQKAYSKSKTEQGLTKEIHHRMMNHPGASNSGDSLSPL